MKSVRAAAAVTAVVVALSAVLGCNRSLAGLRNKTVAQLTQGDERGYCVATDAQDLVNVARNLCTVGRKYLPERSLAALEQACDKVETAGLRLNAAMVQALRDDAGTVLAELALADGVSEKDKGYLAGFAVDMDSAMERMEHDPYNDAARDFNAIESAFPANVLGVFVGPVYPFEF